VDFSLANLSHILLLGLWALLWFLGGWWIVRSAFNLRPNEEGLVGFACGLVIEVWLSNLLGRFIPVPWSFWAAAGFVFLLGLILAFLKGWRTVLRLPVIPSQWLLLIILFYLFTAVSRGLAIFDDYAHLPTTSLMAAGFIPPRFALDPNVSYGYHYFLILFAAQTARIGNFFAWTALDISRGLSIALAILLSAVWIQRLTRSSFAGFLGGLFTAFGMGTRWLLLLFPGALLHLISPHIEMLGSAAQSAPDIITALTGNWIIEGGGPLPFPFAFANGINQPGILSFGPNGLIGAAITYPLLLTFNRWKSRLAPLITIILLAASSLMGETGLVLSLAGLAILTLVYFIQHRTLRLPKSLWTWWGIFLAMVIVSVLQGGTWTDLFFGFFEKVSQGAVGDSYQTIGFSLMWPISVVSSHLGVLSLLNPWQLVIALLEIGPLLMVAPLVLIWGWKSYKAGRWFEAITILGGYLTVFTLLIQFTGSAGVRNTSRLYGFIGTTALFTVPVLWNWLEQRSDLVKALASAWGSLILFGGIVLFGIELLAAQKPVSSTFISQMDVTFYQKYWNKLDRDALIFDPDTFRAPTVFGRYTDSSTTWLVQKPEWIELSEKPDPYALHAAGFDYMYFDYVYWYDVDAQYKEMLTSDPCVHLVEEIPAKHVEDFRRLLDISTCQRVETPAP
jgi:hypothetical protein